MSTSGYYRFPTIHDDTVVFVSEDDLWSVARSGGIARRLTSNLGATTDPALSPDGAYLAFVGREEGTSEVYVMPALGGAARRLTYLSSSCRVLGWNAAGTHILFAGNYGQIANAAMVLFQVDVFGSGHQVEQLPYGQAAAIAYGPDGAVVLGRNTGEPARWKRYRGGNAGHLWIDRAGNGEFERLLPEMTGNITGPLWVQEGGADRVFFVSDHEGVGNLYSVTPDGDDLRRHTDHADYYVRNPATDGRRIVYHAGADLFVYDIESGLSTEVDVQYHSPRVQRNRKFVHAGRYLDYARLHPTGTGLAVTARGKSFAFYNFDGPVLQQGRRDGVRYRLPDWLNDGQRLVLISDEAGEEVIEIHSTDPEEDPVLLEDLDIGRAVALKVSPVEDKVALTNHRHELLIVDLERRTLTLVDRSPYHHVAGFDWSPDGRWLAYGCAVSPQTTALRLYQLPDEPEVAEGGNQPEGQVHTITAPVLHDVLPSFDPQGRFLYFLSYREFNPVYDGLHFDLGFPWGMRPYLLRLRNDVPNPFLPKPDLGSNGGNDHDDEEADEDEIEEGNEDEDAFDDTFDHGDDEGLDDDELGDDGAGDDGAGDDGAGDDGAEEESALAVPEAGADGLTGSAVEVAAVAPDSRTLPGADVPPAQEHADDATAETPGEEGGEDEPVLRNKTPRLRIDLDGIERRIIAFPVPDGRYGAIHGTKDKAVFSDFPIHGQLDGDAEWNDGDDVDHGTLRAWSFKEYKSETLVEDADWFALSRNRRKLIYGIGSRLRVISAAEKPPSGGGHPRKTGWVDLTRVKVSVDPQCEWEQMYREAWRLQRDQFWSEDMNQLDWEQIYHRYFPLIERVSTRSEFSDLMWEMQGELGTSHAYEFGGDYRPRPVYAQGYLGAELTWDATAGGYRIGEPVIGDPWDTRHSSPLADPALDIRSDDVIMAVNGQRVDAETSPLQLLVNQADQDVLLSLAARAEDETESEEEASVQDGAVAEADDQPAADEEAPEPALRHVTVHTIRTNRPALYRRWVEENRAVVHARSDGRVGYVHIPDMGARGYAEFHRGYLAEIARDALIVDVRYNGGGHVSQLILEKLARRRIGYDFSRWGGSFPYPVESVAGPIVALTNEHAGSDGDIFCHSFKLLKLGPLIGRRTWGGVVGISPRHPLVDGTVTTQPEYSFWFEDVGWNVENYGTDPDIEVDIRPQDFVAGVDPQLDRAVAEILALLAENPVELPDLSSRPSRALPTLPPRSSSA